jgi:hypothetical protein
MADQVEESLFGNSSEIRLLADERERLAADDSTGGRTFHEYIVQRDQTRALKDIKMKKAVDLVENALPWTGSALKDSAQSGQVSTGHSGSIFSSQDSAGASAALVQAADHLETILQGSEYSPRTTTSLSRGRW